MKKDTILLIITFFLATTESATSQTSMVIADDYDKGKNQTTLILIPYGNIVIPKKWTKTRYNEVSRQHFFRNGDSTTVSVSKNPKEKYPFYKKKKTDKDFVSDFVKWDADFYKENGIDVTTVKDASESGYILWQTKVKNGNTIMLYGSKNGYAYGFSVSSKSWSDLEMVDFLEKLYREN